MEIINSEEKQIIAKVGLDLNISAQKLAEALGVHRSTVYRYAEEPTNEEMRQFETEIKHIFELKRKLVLASILKNIGEQTDIADMKSLVNAYVALLK